MCLLVVLHRAYDHWPLVVAANRDEMLARRSRAMGILQDRGPRIVGGQDEVAGGTWMAINEHGVVAGLTNKPPKPKYDAALRSRGELPLMLANHGTAEAAVAAFAVDAADYNPCWMFVADNDSLFYIDVTGTGRPRHEKLPPGVHVLENAPLDGNTDKQREVLAALSGFEGWRPEAFVDTLVEVMKSHENPAACVHYGPYGTKSASIVVNDPSPRVWSAEGPLCTTEITEQPGLWDPARDPGSS